MAARTVRLVTRDCAGSIRIREFSGFEELLGSHEQIGIDDCSTDLELRTCPVFRGLVGPIPDGKGIARYESPEVFETLTKEWATTRTRRRRRRTEDQHAVVPGAPILFNLPAATESMVNF
jgi:hypothetical protein